MNRFDNAIALATRLIAKNGQKATWIQVKDAVDGAQPWNAIQGANVSRSVTICFIPANNNEWRKLLAYMKGTEVPTGRIAGLMAPVNFDLALKDVVVRNGVTLRINTIDTIQPNEQKVLHLIEFSE